MTKTESKLNINGVTCIEDIYFIEVTTRYISSSVLKHQNCHECAARVEILMFSTHEMNRKKSKLSFYFILFNGYIQCLTH